MTQLHKRINICRRGKTGCEISVEYYENIWKCVKVSIQIIEKLPGEDYKSCIKEGDMLEYRLQRGDYWIKTYVMLILII